MKTTLFFALFCLAAAAVMAIPAEKAEGQEEYDVVNKVEEQDNAPIVEPYVSCQWCGNTCCNAHCVMMGNGGGKCNSDLVCICWN